MIPSVGLLYISLSLEPRQIVVYRRAWYALEVRIIPYGEAFSLVLEQIPHQLPLASSIGNRGGRVCPFLGVSLRWVSVLGHACLVLNSL